MSPDDFLENLDPEQRAAVISDARTLCVLAGAGSGKTRVLTRRVARRIANGSADAAHTLVLTFTRKAADELRQRLVRSQVDADITTGTFHSIAFGQLRRRWLEQGRPVPAIASNPTRIIDAVLQTMRLGRSMSSRTLAGEIAWAKSHGLSPEGYEESLHRLGRRPPIASHQVVRVYEAYESEKRKRRTIDYDDLLLLTTSALEEDRSFAAAQRWLFRHIYVDEFQDLNRAQFQLLRAWLGDNDDLFVVGDPNQAIYGWNGADASFLRSIDRHFPGIEICSLQTNYRSTSEILGAASAVLPAATASSRLSHVPEQREIGTPPLVIECADEREEAHLIARRVREAHSRGHRWTDLAVLVRTNAQRGPIEAAFEELGIPCRASGGATWLYRSEVRVALEHLRESPRRPLAQRVVDIEEMARDSSDAVRPYLDELVGSARQCLETDPDVLIVDFLAWVEIASRQDGPPAAWGQRDGSVVVTTFHRAKGLEWPMVVLAGVEEGLVPYGNPGGDQMAEEQRLFYVAVTRARSELLCTWAAKRTSARGETSSRKPSPWLAEMQRSAGPNPVASPAVAAEVIRDARRVLDLAEDGDELRAAVVRWRAARAKLNGIEARLVLADAVVDAIVERRPATREALAAIEGIGPVRAVSIGDDLLKLVASTNPVLTSGQ